MFILPRYVEINTFVQSMRNYLFIFQLNYSLYKDVLEVVSKASFFRCRQCPFPWIPTVCCEFLLFFGGIASFIVACNQYINYKSDNQKKDNADLSDIVMMIFYGLIIIGAILWFIVGSVHRLTVRRWISFSHKHKFTLMWLIYSFTLQFLNSKA